MQAQQLMSMQESDAPQPDQESFSCFVGDLSADVTDITLQETFRQFYPSVHCAKVITDPATGRSKGYGFVRFASEAERDRALDMQGFNLNGGPMRVSLATARRNAGGGGGGAGAAANAAPHPADLDPTNTTLFIGGLSAGVTEDQLRLTFGQYGDIVYTKIPIGKGCGFVQFVERPAAEMAMMALNGGVIGSTAIRISWGRSTARAPHIRDAAAAAAATTVYCGGGAYAAPGMVMAGLGAGAYPGVSGFRSGFGGLHGATVLAGNPYGAPAYGAPVAAFGGASSPMLITNPPGVHPSMTLVPANTAGAQHMAAQVGAPYPRVPSQAHMAASGQLLPGSAPFHAVVSEGAPPLLQMDGGAAATMGAMGAMGAAAVDKMSAAAFMVQQQQMTGGGGNGFLLQRN